MPVKRKSRGRSKGSKGSSSLVQCANCGAMVPRD
ncbi:MAG: 30S ribosomal protein S26e, partial [Candidatus Bathyarchaeota archaeon]|nr:30S ribosomal protein S26e [Candidatus Bathyarchaeota archaeon]